MIQHRAAHTLSGGDLGWLKGRHHFKVTPDGNPAHGPLGPLIVWNDDEVAPGTGFGLHPHADVEIITFVREGIVTHRDSTGGVGQLTECTQVSDQGHGIIRCPGLHREDQVAAWRKVTDAVHAAGGRIYCQIWHCGRVAHPDMRGGEPPVAPSPIPATGDFFLPSGRVDFPVPRELRLDEIPGIVASFAAATRNARAAGFDGVELHGANGYLQDQFLQDGSNQRRDAYGGSVENRARLMLETTDAMVGAWDAAHVGVRLSPSSYLYGVDDSDKRATFGYVIEKLSALAYLCLLEPNAKDAERGVQIEHVAETFKPLVAVPLIVNTGFDKAKADAVLKAGDADLVAFGVPYIANPDLVRRFREDAPLSQPDTATFYGVGAKGYTDYPALED